MTLLHVVLNNNLSLTASSPTVVPHHYCLSSHREMRAEFADMFSSEILLQINFLFTDKTPELIGADSGGEEGQDSQQEEVERDHVHTEVLQQVEVAVIDLEVVEVSIFDEQLYPVDRLIKARPLV